MKNEKLLTCIGDINPDFIENAEQCVHKKTRVVRMRKVFVIAATAVVILTFTGATIAEYYGGWLSNSIWWGVEKDYQYTVEEKDGVTMKTHSNKNGDFIFEFSGADSATYTDIDGTITIYTSKSENAEFTLKIPTEIMRGKISGNSTRSKPFTFVVV